MKIPMIGQGTGHKGECFQTYDAQADFFASTIRFGIENGLNLIDTAEVYSDGRSELIVGNAVKGIRNEVLIATKFSPDHHQKIDVIEAAEGSLKRLKSDHIDLYQIHWPNSEIPLADTLNAMWKLQTQGKVLEVGISNFNLGQLENAISIAKIEKKRIYSLQIKFNLIDRFAYNQVKELCESNSINIIAYSPLRHVMNQKINGKDIVNKIARDLSATPIQIALSWVISHPQVTAIPESSNFGHIIELANSRKIFLNEIQKEEIGLVFDSKITFIQVSKISSQNRGRNESSPNKSYDEILSFSNDFCPSIEQLSCEIEEDNFLQPILIRLIYDHCDSYEIVEGELRYWAFVLRFGLESKIPALVIE